MCHAMHGRNKSAECLCSNNESRGRPKGHGGIVQKIGKGDIVRRNIVRRGDFVGSGQQDRRRDHQIQRHAGNRKVFACLGNGQHLAEVGRVVDVVERLVAIVFRRGLVMVGAGMVVVMMGVRRSLIVPVGHEVVRLEHRKCQEQEKDYGVAALHFRRKYNLKQEKRLENSVSERTVHPTHQG